MLKIRNRYSAEDVQKRWAELSDLTKPTLHESANQASRSTLLNKVSAADGKTYGIVLESSKYFVKVANTDVDESDSKDFKYIGGQANALHERFDSYPAAVRRLNIKVASLRESFQMQDEPVEDEEDALLADLEAKEHEKDTEATAETELPAEDGLEDVMADMPADMTGDAPAESGEEAMGDLGDMGADGGEVDAADALGLDAEGGAEGDSKFDGMGDDDSDADSDEDPASQVQELMGKIGVALDGMTDMPESVLNNVLNTMITKCERGLENASDETIHKLTTRIEKRGKKMDEEGADEDGQMLDETDEMDEAALGDSNSRAKAAQDQNFAAKNRQSAANAGHQEIRDQFMDSAEAKVKSSAQRRNNSFKNSAPMQSLPEGEDEREMDYERNSGEDMHSDPAAMEDGDVSFEEFVNQYADHYPEDDDQTRAQRIIDYLDNYGSSVSEFCVNQAFDEFESEMTPEVKEMVLAAAQQTPSLTPFVGMLQNTGASAQGLNENYLLKLVKELVNEEKKNFIKK
jgi:hypothetical protein